MFKKTDNDNGVFLLLHKLSFYNKWNVKLFCLIKNFISFNFFFFPGGWLLVSNVVVGNLSSLLFSEESSYHEISNYHKKSFLITADAMKELRTQLSFTQLRFHCSKNKGRTMIQNSTLLEIQTQHRLGLIQFLNSQVLVHIFCNSTSY